MAPGSTGAPARVDCVAGGNNDAPHGWIHSCEATVKPCTGRFYPCEATVKPCTGRFYPCGATVEPLPGSILPV
jgi:hypothetical protein